MNDYNQEDKSSATAGDLDINEFLSSKGTS